MQQKSEFKKCKKQVSQLNIIDPEHLHIDFIIDWNKMFPVNSFASFFEVFRATHLTVYICPTEQEINITDIIAFIDILNKKQRKFSVHIDLETTCSFSETDFPRLFERRVLFRYPLLLEEYDRLPNTSIENITKLSEYGLPVLFNIYLSNTFHHSSISDIVKRLMTINYSAGLSLYPANYALNEKFYRVRPETTRWIKTLMNVYKDFSYFDLLFEPMNEIVDIVSFGGVSHTREIPRFIKIRVTAKGELKIFRQNPNKAILWKMLTDLDGETPSSIINDLYETIRKQYSSINHQCQFFSSCCGIDEECPFLDSHIIPPLECETRRFFIRAFQEQKQAIRDLNHIS